MTNSTGNTMALATKTQRDAAVERIENDTAVVISGWNSLLELWLFLRALERRRVITRGDAAAAQQDLERVKAALEVARAILAERRADPLGTAEERDV
jgi:hypothetical protein